jgi:hypothetical protein
MNITFQAFMKTTSKDQYAELLAEKTNTGLDIHCWHVENSSATMNSNCEVYARRYQQSRCASKSCSFHVFPVKGSGSCMYQKEMSKRLVRCPCPDEKINVTIWLDLLHSLCPLHGDLERSKNNGCRSKVAGVGVSSQYEKYFVRAYRNQHSN